jgi:hypothetical protein
MNKLSIALLCTLASLSTSQSFARDRVIHEDTVSHKYLAEIIKVKRFETMQTGVIIYKRKDGTCYENKVLMTDKREVQTELGKVFVVDSKTETKDILCPS